MARPNIHFQDKRNEILKKALQLFMEQGYEETTITHVMQASQISKGALYHYFQSKEEILQAVLEYLLQADYERIKPLLENPGLSALEKLQGLFGPKVGVAQEVHQVEQYFQGRAKSLFHYRLQEQSFVQTARVLAQVLHQGIAEQVFTTAYPEEMAAFVVASIQSVLVGTQAQKQHLPRQVSALVALMEQCFGTAPGGLQFVQPLLLQQLQPYV